MAALNSILERLQANRQARGKPTGFLDDWLNAGGVGSGFLRDKYAELRQNVDNGNRPFLQALRDHSNSLLMGGAGISSGQRGAFGPAFAQGAQIDQQNADYRRQLAQQQAYQDAVAQATAGAPSSLAPLLNADPDLGAQWAIAQATPSQAEAPNVRTLFGGPNGEESNWDYAWNPQSGQWDIPVGPAEVSASLLNQTINTGDPVDTRPQTGTVSAGMERIWVPNPDEMGGGHYVDRPIQGGEAEREQQQVAQAAQADIETRVQQASILDQTIAHATWLLQNDPQLAGYTGRLADIINTPAGAQLRADLNTIQSLIAVDSMLELKRASATGSTGFGALSERELSVLQSQLGVFGDLYVGSDYLLNNLQRAQGIYQGILNELTGGTYAARGFGTNVQTPAGYQGGFSGGIPLLGGQQQQGAPTLGGPAYQPMANPPGLPAGNYQFDPATGRLIQTSP